MLNVLVRRYLDIALVVHVRDTHWVHQWKRLGKAARRLRIRRFVVHVRPAVSEALGSPFSVCIFLGRSSPALGNGPSLNATSERSHSDHLFEQPLDQVFPFVERRRVFQGKRPDAQQLPTQSPDSEGTTARCLAAQLQEQIVECRIGLMHPFVRGRRFIRKASTHPPSPNQISKREL